MTNRGNEIRVGDLACAGHWRLKPAACRQHRRKAVFPIDLPEPFGLPIIDVMTCGAAFYGYPTLIHRLSYRRHNHEKLSSTTWIGEEGTTTTPFASLAPDASNRILRLSNEVEKTTNRYWSTMEGHKLHVGEHGEDMPEVADWRWSLQKS